MPKALPEHLHPLSLARGGGSLAGRLDIHEMPRLAGALHARGSEAVVALDFRLDDAGRALVTGVIEAELVVLCQRCLEPMTLPVKREVRLAVVRSDEEAARLAPELEPLLVDDESVALATLVEDELILALPSYPRHAPGQCQAPAGADQLAEADTGEGDNPFAVLQSLKGDGKD